MNAAEIGKRYVALNKEGRHQEILDELFAENAVSVEAWAPPGTDKTATGLPAIRAKGKAWGEQHEIHSAEVSGPYPNDNRFTVRFVYDVTNKPSNRRMNMDEVGLFTIENGKIVKEEFFYSAG